VTAAGAGRGAHWDDDPAAYEEVVLVDLLDRLLDKGVVVAGDITLSVADVDLVYLGLRLFLGSASTAERVGISLPSSAALQRSALDAEPTGSTSLEADALGASATDSSALDSSALDSSALDSSALDSSSPGGAGADRTGEDAGEDGARDGLDSDLGFPGGRP
jgi:hypothetical protein